MEIARIDDLPLYNDDVRLTDYITCANASCF
jgi:hypothetical protein